MTMRFQSILALLPILGGCATSQTFDHTQSAPALPTAEEVSRYVSSHWPDLSKTFARFANRPGQTATLIGISEVSCGHTYTTPECSYQVAGRFGDESSVERRLLSQFERDDAGNLVEVIVMWHVRRR
ncbi:hypothetical protein [Sphingomonas sp. BK235]|uniref:hypothetical protein n=1 Tax=Sphingomonas sp. BK235 TaxID=2512131 RepID=UPI00104D7CCF|nr:hypothetical protein [Sphingomonas sp. BK235]